MSKPHISEEAVRIVQRFKLTDFVIYTPLIVMTVLVVTLFYLRNSSRIENAPTAAGIKEQKIGTKKMKRIMFKKQKREQREAMEERISTDLIREMIRDEADEKQKKVEARNSEKQLNYVEHLRIESHVVHVIPEADLIRKLNHAHCCTLQDTEVASCQKLIRSGKVNGIINDSRFIRFDAMFLNEVAAIIDCTGKIAVADLALQIQSIIDEADAMAYKQEI